MQPRLRIRGPLRTTAVALPSTSRNTARPSSAPPERATVWAWLEPAPARRVVIPKYRRAVVVELYRVTLSRTPKLLTTLREGGGYAQSSALTKSREVIDMGKALLGPAGVPTILLTASTGRRSHSPPVAAARADFGLPVWTLVAIVLEVSADPGPDSRAVGAGPLQALNAAHATTAATNRPRRQTVSAIVWRVSNGSKRPPV